jgi:hypothetical protein
VYDQPWPQGRHTATGDTHRRLIVLPNRDVNTDSQGRVWPDHFFKEHIMKSGQLLLCVDNFCGASRNYLHIGHIYTFEKHNDLRGEWVCVQENTIWSFYFKNFIALREEQCKNKLFKLVRL